MVNFVWFLFVFVCFLLMLVVLLQRGEAGGLGGAFGGGGGDTAFGVKADTTWKKATSVLAALFFCLALVLGSLMSNAGRASLAAGEAQTEEAAGSGEAAGGESAGESGAAASAEKSESE